MRRKDPQKDHFLIQQPKPTARPMLTQLLRLTRPFKPMLPSRSPLLHRRTSHSSKKTSRFQTSTIENMSRQSREFCRMMSHSKPSPNLAPKWPPSNLTIQFSWSAGALTNRKICHIGLLGIPTAIPGACVAISTSVEAKTILELNRSSAVTILNLCKTTDQQQPQIVTYIN